MKKLVSLLLLLVLLASLSPAMAGDLGVQVIGGENVIAEVVALEDLQLGDTYEIDGYAKAEPKSFVFADTYAQFHKDCANHNLSDYYSYYPTSAEIFYNMNRKHVYKQASWVDSKDAAEFAWFMMDLSNLSIKSKNFLPEISVVCVYDDEYTFQGSFAFARFFFRPAVSLSA